MANKDMDLYRRRGWSPLREVSSLHRGIDRLFDDFFNLAPGQQDWPAQFNFNPAVDVEEAEDHYLISVDLPGVKKDDVKIEMQDNQLMISGERREEHEEKEKKRNRHFVERSYGSFQRMFTLPPNVDMDKVEADFEDGVLRIALPKGEKARGRKVEIGGQKGHGLLTRMMGGKKEEQKKAAG